ncbi:Hsp20/alpha crystallin family protein [Cecembia calidifontis]|uniref:Hsp20/alpha crystallin family protein n=1 Tax=Cecembia calidifontis TaxID=1187080 RepID=A0A4Q7P7C1_9BACT|nr:Hsp20/alpha crystallin family protein [Cecembia calidifontis]
MAIVKYDSNRAFPAFSSLFDDFFNTEFGNWRHNNFSATNTTLPAVNIKEDNDGFLVEMAAPGMEKADFKINLENNVLTISSEKQEEQKKNKISTLVENLLIVLSNVLSPCLIVQIVKKSKPSTKTVCCK